MSSLFPSRTNIKPDRAEKLAWLRLARTPNIGPITLYRLIDAYGTAIDALSALPELSKRGGRKKPLKAPSESSVVAEIKALHKLKGRIITAMCPEYPLALSATPDAPPVLSCIGDVSLLNTACVGIVGARNASLNGKKFTAKLSRGLAERGQTIVSGLARGIDTAAHTACVEDERGQGLNAKTIAVVAGGIDVVYPSENQELYEQICKHGLVVAESALGQKPFARSFPRRNRIVSGISAGVVVVEATMRSGSLITARLAGEQGRDVFAVPGNPLDPRASGTNHLIRQGATLVRSAEDVMETLNDFSGGMRDVASTPQYRAENNAEFSSLADENPPENLHETILSHLSFTPIGVDELVRACHVSIPTMHMAVLELELAARIKRNASNGIILLEE